MKKTYVLVHGACRSARSWGAVQTSLVAAGHRVETPTLTGVGEKAHLLNPDVNLTTFIRDIVDVIETSALANVILIGHSFSGLVVSGVADRIGDRLKHLVFLDALIPVSGKSAFDLLPPHVAVERRRLARASASGLVFPDEPIGAWPTDVISELSTSHPLKSYEEPIHLRYPVGNMVPVTYLACTAPLNSKLANSHAYARQMMPHWQFVELCAPHDAMIYEPDLVAEHILDL